jgi:hypothetical protein
MSNEIQLPRHMWKGAISYHDENNAHETNHVQVNQVLGHQTRLQHRSWQEQQQRAAEDKAIQIKKKYLTHQQK